MDMHSAFANIFIAGKYEAIAETLHKLIVAGKENDAICILARENTLDPRKVILNGLRTFPGVKEHAQRIEQINRKPSYSL
jgi:hypothetical protein